jgi:hypothetical protein
MMSHQKLLKQVVSTPAARLVVALFLAASCFFPEEARAQVAPQQVRWGPQEIRLEAKGEHAWWAFPASVQLVHETSGQRLELKAFWNGGSDWVVRFAPPLAGKWSWQSKSVDPGLDGRTGEIHVAEPSSTQIENNANYRGHLRIAASARHFEYADGTPCLLLADTLWAGNTARCGLGEREDGPFFQYLADRKSKGFNAVLMKYVHGFDDHDDRPTGDRNEGGYLFLERDFERLNPAFMQALDKRLNALFHNGFVAAVPVAWWGKGRLNAFSIDQARKFSAYCAVRYGAYNALWCLSGEYQYTFKDCNWTEADIDSLGAAVQAQNPYRHPLSIHPSGQITWQPPHNVQSSRPFHHSKWLDHHWLQTGQSSDRMFNIVGRSAENRQLEPARPVFCSEAYYDRQIDPEQAYHARWQAWTAILSGCCGYGYGAQGLWQFYDPADPRGETGKNVANAAVWRQALAFQGSSKIRHVRELLGTLEWWRLAPSRELLLVDGQPNTSPTSRDVSPPTCAAIAGEVYLVYLPRGNAKRSLQIKELPTASYAASWFNPRDGKGKLNEVRFEGGPKPWALPTPPADADEDWVLVVRRTR